MRWPADFSFFATLQLSNISASHEIFMPLDIDKIVSEEEVEEPAVLAREILIHKMIRC